MRFRRRLRTRIILSFVLLGFFLTALFAVSTVYLRNRLEGQLLDNSLQKEVDSLVEQVRTHPEQPESFSLLYARTWSAQKAYAMPLELQHLQTGVHDLIQIDGDGRTHHYKYAIRRDADWVSFVRYDVSSAALGERQLLLTLAGAVLLFSGLAWLVGIWSSSRVISPVSELARRVERMAGREHSEPLASHFPKDEVGELASALDGYAERMTAMVKRDREFNSDVSHELRTPLAVIRGAAELLLSNPDLNEKTRLRLQRIERAAIQCTDLTTALLMLSRNERGHGRTDLYKLAGQLAEAGRIQLGNKPVSVMVEGASDAFADAPESVVAVALGNLIGNACKYTAEGEVKVTVLADRVLIADTGPGLSREDAEHLFERGYRGSGAGGTTGGGIGLSIVRRLCDLYGWQVSIAPREDRGAIAVLRFTQA